MGNINTDGIQHRSILKKIARRIMIERGLVADFPANVSEELKKINEPEEKYEKSIRDLRHLPWCSIDNDDSLDLDQLTIAWTESTELNNIMIAIADVDALVKKDSVIDCHAKKNTTSIYTVAETFPMLPEKLSTNLTSLNHESDRLAIVIEIMLSSDGFLKSSKIYRALVNNHAKLAYNSVASWLEGKSPMPSVIGTISGMEENIRLQDKLAQKLKTLRYLNGALDFETIEVRPVFCGDELKNLVPDNRNRAKDIIEEFMICANRIIVQYLSSKHFPTFRRVVRVPKYWDKIIEIAKEQGSVLPKKPDSKALEQFLSTAKTIDPVHFPDLSLSIIKLLGSGEYVAQFQEDKPAGHFGLAVKDYAHCTAPNRRYPDIITQRLLKAALNGSHIPYEKKELRRLAKHCTRKEDEVKKAERQVLKSAAAILLESRIGEQFDAIITGASNKGTWVRLMDPPVEGKLVNGFKNMRVGTKLCVKLIRTDINNGYIDFGKVEL
ncbi:MAG: RNB domain-containing ribonuclease [Actinomycetota bacterium]|nr:RNB domain-containing ribonuclease [Actinomycetota bacterium]